MGIPGLACFLGFLPAAYAGRLKPVIAVLNSIITAYIARG